MILEYISDIIYDLLKRKVFTLLTNININNKEFNFHYVLIPFEVILMVALEIYLRYGALMDFLILQHFSG